MRIASITAGAAGMYCGSCLRDNALVAALGKLGHDALLIPTYTPIRTDEPDVSQQRIFFGGINVYLEQKFWLFRHTPRFLDRLLNFRWLLRWVSRFAARTKYSELGQLTVSMLQGTHGKQRKEVAALTDWLAAEVKPDAVILTNALLSGVDSRIRVVAWTYRSSSRCRAMTSSSTLYPPLIANDRSNSFVRTARTSPVLSARAATTRTTCPPISVSPASGCTSSIPASISLVTAAQRMVRTEGPLTIGYFARISPEKGFHHLVDAFIRLRRIPGAPAARLRASGWLGENARSFFNEQVAQIEAAGLAEDFEYVDAPTHADKVRFFQSIDVLSVPTTYREPKGLYILEAWANGVPVVQPRHGTFPELIEQTGGGLIVEPGDADALASGLRRILEDHELRDRTGRAGEAAVRERFTAGTMARGVVSVLEHAARLSTLPT